MNPATKALVDRSNDLARLIWQIKAEADRLWGDINDVVNRHRELEKRLLEGDESVLPEWRQTNERIKAYNQWLNGDLETRRSHVLDEWVEAKKRATKALVEEAGLVDEVLGS